MGFLAPLWLWGLLPWGLFSAWLLVGRRKRERVPFLPLWDAPQELRRPKKGFEPPPVSLVFALLALLLGVLALSEPVIRPRDASRRGKITVVVDRGASMSAVIGEGARYASLAKSVAPRLAGEFGAGPVDLVDVVTGGVEQADRSDWATTVSKWKRTAFDTSDALRSTARRLVDRGEPVVVLSDRDLGFNSDQLVQAMPPDEVKNAAIVRLAAREGQVMITLHANYTTPRTLVVTTAGQSVRREIWIKPGDDQNVFVDVPRLGDVVEASFELGDAFDGDDAAYLVRGRRWPNVEARLPLPDELRRMLVVYQKNRPAGEGSNKISLVGPGELGSDEAGVVVTPVAGDERARGSVVAQNHPALAEVDWTGVERGVAVAEKGPGEGWTVVARVGAQPIVAVREGAARQVWVGFESREFARTPAFVVFWSNVLDWAGSGGEGFASVPVGQGGEKLRRVMPAQLPGDVDGPYWPGVFETATGPIAKAASPVVFSSGSGAWERALARLQVGPGAGRRLAPWLALAALGCLLGATLTWERKKCPASRRAPVHLAVETDEHVEGVVTADGHAHRHATQIPPP
jgi:hypothetical protein